MLYKLATQQIYLACDKEILVCVILCNTGPGRSVLSSVNIRESESELTPRSSSHRSLTSLLNHPSHPHGTILGS